MQGYYERYKKKTEFKLVSVTGAISPWGGTTINDRFLSIYSLNYFKSDIVFN